MKTADATPRKSVGWVMSLFAGLSAPSLAAADLVLLAAAILFVMALGMRAVASLEAPASLHLRPYLRGPPATA